MRRAQAALTDQVAAAVADTIDLDTETGRTVVAGYAHRFPEPAADDRADR